MAGAAQANKEAKPLTFESETIALTLEPGAQTAEIKFPFANNSDKTVEIESLQTACSCLGAKLTDDKKIYQPGDQGEVTALFNVGNLMGTIDKQVIVKLAGEPQGAEPIILTAKITIPELLDISPRTLNWGIDEAPVAKTYKITTHYKQPIHITDVVTTNNQFKPELKTIREGFEYEVTVTPSATSATSFGIIKITSDCEIPRFRRASAFAMVKSGAEK